MSNGRVTLDLVYSESKHSPYAYSPRAIHYFLDSEDNRYEWWTTKDVNHVPGQWYKLSAILKEIRGRKMLSYVKVFNLSHE